MTKLAYLLLCLIPVAWGTTLPMTRSLIDQQGIGVEFIIFVRFIITSIALLPLAWKKLNIERKIIFNAMFVGVFLAAGYSFQFESIKYIDSSFAGVIGSFNIVIIPILSFIIFRSLISKPVLFALPIALVGSLIMAAGASGTVSIIGIILAIIATFTYSMQSVLNGYCKVGDSMRAFTFYMMVSATICTGAYYFVGSALEPSKSVNININSWLQIIYLAIGCTLFPFFAKQFVFKYISVTRATLFMSSELIFTVLFAVLLYGEVVTNIEIVGIILIMIAILVAQEVWKSFSTETPSPMTPRKKRKIDRLRLKRRI